MIVDKFGNEFIEGAVVKLFHFTGARNRKHYMYKIVTKVCNKTSYVSFCHLDSNIFGKKRADFRMTKDQCSEMQIVQAYYRDYRNLKTRK